MTKLQMADLSRVMLGFDRFLNETNNLGAAFDNSYPRFNIVRIGDFKTRIEMAVPGWNKNDIEISLYKGVLTIKGTNKQTPAEGESYIYKGLSGKCFTRTFGVSENIVLDRAYMERGLLCIDLHEEVPEKDLPKVVQID